MSNQWMIYGANGYTGRLCVQEAIRRGERPILAGRNEDAVSSLANQFSLPHRIFSLSDEGLAGHFDGVHTVLHCAGPFSHTSRPVLEACLKAGTHYVDVTGEIAVFEACRRAHGDAMGAGIAVLPGAGFDVVPSDCLAKTLAERLPSATHLTLAFANSGESGFSHGTATTMVENLGAGSAVREDGKIRVIGAGSRQKPIPFRDKRREGVAIPWGDISTAHHSTGIPNIEVYMAVPSRMRKAMKISGHLGPILQSKPAQWALKTLVDKNVTGPNEEARKSSRTQLWGQVADETETVSATLETPEGYTITARASVDIALRIRNNELGPGFHTPSTAFGADYILGFDGCSLEFDA